MMETLFALALGCFVGLCGLMVFIMAIVFFEKDN